jgi:hypothetical protein
MPKQVKIVIPSVSFESDSKLSRIEASAFENCHVLCSICIPASVEIIGEECFSECHNLSRVVFGSGSKLSQFHSVVFRYRSLDCSFSRPSASRARFLRDEAMLDITEPDLNEEAAIAGGSDSDSGSNLKRGAPVGDEIQEPGPVRLGLKRSPVRGHRHVSFPN